MLLEFGVNAAPDRVETAKVAKTNAERNRRLCSGLVY